MPAEFIQHRSPQTNKAKAPYNFVPLPEKVLLAEEFKAHDKYDSERHTGYIELDIKTETPLYTRCAYPANIFSDSRYVDKDGKLKTEFSDKDKPKTTAIPELQQFFHRGDAQIPVIPGSTLRGMTRSLVEIFSYSKISNVSKKQLVYRAVADSTSFGNQYREKMLDIIGNKHFNYPSKHLKGGYLEIDSQGNHFIRPSQEPNGHGESFVLVERNSLPNSHQRTGSQVFVKPVARIQTNNRGGGNISLDLAYTTASITNSTGLVPATIVNTKGIIVRGVDNKHMVAAIYEQNTSINTIDIPKEMWKVYEEDRDMQRSGEQGRELRNPNDPYDPLFYLVDDNKLVFFGPTMMFRLPYSHKAVDLIPEEIKNAGLDMAESIFGMVDEDSKTSIASRVFFSDAIWNPTNINESPFLGGANNGRRVPQILSSPKPTAFQLYLNQNESNHHRTDPTRWFLIKESSIEKMRVEEIPENICQKITGLIGNEYQSEQEYLNALDNLQVRFNNQNQSSRQQKTTILNCSSHELKTYDDIGKTEIRGFKRYWNKKNVGESNWSENAQDVWINDRNRRVEKLDNNGATVESSQHTIIRPVEIDTKFSGRVYFENLTEFELGALLVSLELPPNMRHQIGMAKPYGLGAIEITPTLKIQKRETRYESLFAINGKFEEGEIDSNKSELIKKDSLSKFKNEIKTFVGEFSFNNIQRLKELYTMLAWENSQTGNMKNYIGVPDNHWKERHVLPFPSDIDQIVIQANDDDLAEIGNQVVESKKNELNRISDRKLLKKFGKRLLELDLSDGDKGEIATELFAKADSLGIDLSNSEWFEQINLLVAQYQNK
jgi:CRISPR-associated protein (TIGR03986 family)